MIPDELKTISSNPFGYIRQEKVKKKKIIGYLMPDMPEEIVHAGGALPFLLSGGSPDISIADTRLQGYACSICRRSLAWALKGELGFLDGMVIPIVCDTTRTLAHIWVKNCSFPFYESLLIPRIRNGLYTKEYLCNELDRFKRHLEDFLRVEISNESLSRSISIYNENRRMLRKFDALKKKNQPGISNADFYNVVRSSFIMPKEEHNRLLKEVLRNVNTEEEKSETSRSALKLFISGKYAEPMEVFDYLDRCGCSVVADAFWDSSLSFSSEVSESKDPLKALADFFLSRIPFPVFFDPTRKRSRHMIEQAKAHSVDGVIFLYPKYCDPAAYDYPGIRKSLQKEGVPTLVIEYEFGQGLFAHLKKHLEIFVDMLKSKSQVDKV